MDSLITAAARALAAGDPLAALKRVALRDDPPALALRGIAMAQLGELGRAKELLRNAARGFGPHEATARARCLVAEAEIALVSRDLGGHGGGWAPARAALAAHGDRANAAHAGYLDARRLLLIGRLDEAERALGACDLDALPQASRTGYWLVAAGIAMRRIRAAPARAALERADAAARATGIPALVAEADRAARAFAAPAARLIVRGETRLLGLAEVEALIASETLVVDACRNVVRAGATAVPLASRPVLFALARTLAEAWPADVPRETLLARAFRARDADESHRARLRVEIGRLRQSLAPLAGIERDEPGLPAEAAAGPDGRRARAARRGGPRRGPGPARRWRGLVELGAGARPRRQPPHRPARARGAGGSRQGRILRPWPGLPLDGAERAGFPDELVTPGPLPRG